MATPSSPSASIPESTLPLSEPQRLLNTFIAPSKTFTDLKRKASWWAPWLVMAVLSCLFAYVVDQKVGSDQIVETSLKMAPKDAAQLDRLDPAARQSQLALAAKITQVIIYATPVVLLLLGLLVAVVLMGTINFATGSETNFKTALAVTFYAWLPPSVVKTLIVIASLLAPGFAPEGFFIENPAATNLAAFMSFPPSSPALYKLAAAIDVLGVWTIILLGIGFSAVGKAKRSTATLLVAGWYVFIVLLGVAWAAWKS
ncbi:MAG: YIP1 family protein [Acidobacteriales bacterium]|nr:YIP1 family protein [Terriglobales bacterium]